MRKISTLFITVCLAVASLLAAEINYSPTETEIAFGGNDDNAHMVIRPVGTKALVTDPTIDGLPDGWRYVVGSGTANDLKPATRYMADKYVEGKLTGTYEISTLDFPPKEPADAIVFAGNFPDKIAVGLNQGDAKNAMIIISRGKPRGLDWMGIRGRLADKSARFGWGSPSAKLGPDTYIAYAGPWKGAKVEEIPVPEFDEYTFTVFGYNGDGMAANPNLNPAQNNQRSKTPMMPPPIALEPTEFNREDGYFMARWKKLPAKATYIITVATDPAFGNVLEEYSETDFGDSDQAPVMYTEPGRLYYRVRAVAGRSKSDWSNTVEVTVE